MAGNYWIFRRLPRYAGATAPRGQPCGTLLVTWTNARDEEAG